MTPPSGRRQDRDERGFTLIELLVAMFVLVVVLTIVLNAMTGWVVNSERRASLSDQASDQIEEAFMTLDSEVRYAAVINTPSGPSTSTGYVGDYWVEFESDWTTSSQGSAQCTQVDYETTAGVLRQRSWLLNSSPNGAPSTAGWQVLATGLSTSPSAIPFSLSETAPNLANSSGATTTTTTTTTPSTTTTTVAQEIEATPWQLTVNLSSSLGSGKQSGSAATSFTISAIDVTSSSASEQPVCGGDPT